MPIDHSNLVKDDQVKSNYLDMHDDEVYDEVGLYLFSLKIILKKLSFNNLFFIIFIYIILF